MESIAPTHKVRSYSETIERMLRSVKETKGIEAHLLGTVRANPHRYPFWMVSTPEGRGKKKICLSGGIHGDEPAGVEAILAVIEMIRNRPALLGRFQFILFPCINPFGYEHHTRENRSRIDLNRQYVRKRPAAEIRFVKKVIDGKRFDLDVEFHEDIDTPGFYMYEVFRSPAQAVGRKIIRRVAKKYPINLQTEIEGAPAEKGLISPDVSSDFFKRRFARKRQWPQALYFYMNGASHVITSETPVHLKMQERVEIHLIALKTALERLLSA
ncbi:MAG: M14 family metallocarboxypeptidase [Candidatus Manganitrophus sp.]|nr:MAG: M14 family metallocarboxypeptidase [Candidatus Manganitrophus sp.]